MDEPTHEEKLATLRGEDTDWGYWVSVPPVPTTLWSPDDWIRFIGNRWYRRKDQRGDERNA